MKFAFDIPKDSIFTKELGKLRMQQGSVRAGQIRGAQIALTEEKSTFYLKPKNEQRTSKRTS